MKLFTSNKLSEYYSIYPKKVIAYKDCTHSQNRWKVCKFIYLSIAILSLIIAPSIVMLSPRVSRKDLLNIKKKR